jgi:transcriptional regulator with XRE-family HTH domain
LKANFIRFRYNFENNQFKTLFHHLKHNEKMQTVLSNIKKRRETLGFSQDYVAHELDISQAAYSKLESGKTEMSVSQFLSLCRVLQEDFNALIQDETRTKQTPPSIEMRLNAIEKELNTLKSRLVMA